jgi:HK97 family phage major capsid protein/HK97 family phage prohead protease
MQDIVEPKGAQFKLPMPFLWQHNHADPIGWITKAKVTKEGIEVEGEVADIPETGELKSRLLKAWQMIKNGLVRGLSIGFSVLEHGWIESTGGMHILKWNWLELSAVTIPANEEATIVAIKAASSQKQIPSVIGKSKSGGREMNLREQLEKFMEARATKIARLGELTDVVKSVSASVDENAEFDQLTKEIEALDNDIRVKKAEMVMSDSAQAVKPVVKTAPAIIIKKTDADDKFQGQAFTRFVIAKALATVEGVSPIAIAEKRWGRTNPMLASLIKTAVAGGGSDSGEWGAELVAADARYTGDFIAYLQSKTVFDKLGLREIPANVQIKGQDGVATGYWVGQSKPIPVSKADFSAVNLSPLKVAALAVVSNELLRDSSPAAEMLVRDALVEASSQRVDATFLGAGAASSGVSPAGILNGVSGGSTTGNDASGLIEDVKALYATFIAAKNASGLKFVMNPALAKAIQLMRNTLGLIEFPGIGVDGGTLLGDMVVTGDNVNANHLILLKPSDIYRIGDTGVQISISREAMIEMDDAPAGASDTPVGASTAMVSMFQSESTAIKVVRAINYAKRRAGVVQYISDADYGTTSSS